MKICTLLLLLISNGFPAFWQVNSHMGVGVTRASSGEEILNTMGYTGFGNPMFQVQGEVVRVYDKILLGLNWGVFEGGIKRAKQKVDPNLTATINLVGMNAIVGKKYIEKDQFDLWGTAEIGFGRFGSGSGTAEAEPEVYNRFYLNGSLGLEGAYNMRYTSRGYYVLGPYLKGGVAKTYENEGVYFPIVMCGLKMGLAFAKI